MKILLIRLKELFFENQKLCCVPPVGLWSIRTYIKTYSDAEVEICDEHMGQKIEDFLNNVNYDIIGISVQFSIQHSEYLKMAKKVRQLNQNATIIAGGFHASAVEKPKEVDEIVHGEGEGYFSRLFFGKEIEDFDSIPYPQFDIKEIEEYWRIDKAHDLESKTKKWITIETSRGCSNKCSFCGIPRFWGKWKGHSAEYLYDHFKYLKDKGIEEVFIADDNLSANRARFLKLIEHLNNLGIWWSAPNGIQVNTINNPEVLNALEGSTCWKLCLPFETGVKSSAKLMNIGGKYMEFDKAFNLVISLKNIGIKTNGFFVIGYPGETMDNVKETLEFANSLPFDGRHVHIASPFPGSPLYDLCKEKGYLVYDGEELYKQLLLADGGLIKTDKIDPKELFEIKAKDREDAIERRKQGKY